MASAGITSLLRSVGRKLADAPPPHHLLSASGFHGHAPGFLCCYCRRFSSSSPACSYNEDHTQNKKVAIEAAWKDGLKMFSFFLMFGTVVGMYGWVLPTMDRIKTGQRKNNDELMQVLTEMNKTLVQHRELLEGLREYLEGRTNYSQAQSAQTSSGNAKEMKKMLPEDLDKST